MTANDDLDDVRAAMNSDLEAFGRLATRYAPALTAFVFGQTGNMADAQDLVQDTLIRAFRSIRSLRDANRFLPWLFQIARNECNQRFRHSTAHRQATSLLAQQQTAGSPDRPDDALRQEETAQQLRAAVNDLSDPLREIILLRYFAGLTRSETTEALDLTADAYDKRHQRAMEELRRHLSPES